MIAGVDFDSFGVYIAELPYEESRDGADARFIAIKFRKTSGLEARADFAFEAVLRLPRLIGGTLAPYTAENVFVELGRGASRRSDFLLGRVQGAIAATFASVDSCSVIEMSAQEWKKALTGNGNAPKDVAHLELARRYGGKMPADENMRDALAIAFVGRELIRQAIAAA